MAGWGVLLEMKQENPTVNVIMASERIKGTQTFLSSFVR
jgi:hypothetical protein